MKHLSRLAILLATSLAAHADVVIEQKVESPAMSGSMTMKIKGDQARMDMPSPAGDATVLLNIKAGEITSLMHAQKMAMKLPLSAIKQQSEAMQKQAGIDPSKVVKPKATGVMEKVGAWNAEIYEFSIGGTTGKLWVVKDFPDAQAIKEELKKLSAANPSNLDPSTLDVPGMVVKSEMATPVGKTTTTLVKAAIAPVADTEFALPKDYQEMTMPTAPAAAPK